MCPWCEAEDCIQYGHIEFIESGCMQQKAQYDTCNKVWMEVWELIEVCELVPSARLHGVRYEGSFSGFGIAFIILCVVVLVTQAIVADYEIVQEKKNE